MDRTPKASRLKAKSVGHRQAAPVSRGRPARRNEGPASSKRIIIVSNRGPHDFVWSEDRWNATRSSGGVVSMIEPLARRPDVAWYCCVADALGDNDTHAGILTTAGDQLDPELGVVPVSIPAEMYQQYYGAISNEVLWMLQHRLVGQFGYRYLDERLHRAWTAGYLEANRRLAQRIAATCKSVRAFLVQDYHLYPLPRLLRERFPCVPILHFTHIPFPDPPTLRLIPAAWRQVILEGLLGADIVGMQTPADVRNFRQACKEFLAADSSADQTSVIAPDGRDVRVRVYPAATDPSAVRALMDSDAVRKAQRALTAPPDFSTVLRVDRLDPSKNQIVGFLAYERLLETRPELASRVRFLAFLIPSRTDLSVYRDYRDAVYRLIGRINERFGADRPMDQPPVKVYYENNRDQALAAMADCDVLLANSYQDGMNLVVKEWAVVSQRPGVVIVSETAGVAAETGDNAMLVSPLDVEGTAQAMAEALEMPFSERALRLTRIRDGVLRWTAERWLAAQMTELLPEATTPEGMMPVPASR